MSVSGELVLLKNRLEWTSLNHVMYYVYAIKTEMTSYTSI